MIHYTRICDNFKEKISGRIENLVAPVEKIEPQFGMGNSPLLQGNPSNSKTNYQCANWA